MYTNKFFLKTAQRKALMITLIAALIGQMILPGRAAAWKITTHVYFADIVLADALDDGKVTINRVDYRTGEIIGVIGEYAVDSEILAALQSNPGQYRAGTIGPDAYPDILTGQQIIHPDSESTQVEGGSDAWLRYLWEQSKNEDYKDNKAVTAFTVGFLTHAGGDVYAHTMVNNFAGGAFTFDPLENAVKHVLLEDYIDKRLPKEALDSDFFDPNNMSLAGVEDGANDFIYKTMIDARPGTKLDSELMKEGTFGGKLSVPRIFSSVRANLQEDISKTDCDFWELDCIAKDEYKKAWRDDVDDGLRAWPQTSHKILLKIGFNEDREVKASEAVQIGEDYVLDHLLSMAGLPDILPDFLDELQRIIDKIIPSDIKEEIDELKKELLNDLLVDALGMTVEQIKAFFTNPELWFDVAMNNGSGEDVSLQRFNQEFLGIDDSGYADPNESFDYKEFRSAYNTVTIAKLTLLSQSEVNRLLADLGSSARLEEANIMLGFAATLDGDNQWLNGMVLAQDRAVYEQIFMQQAGERVGFSTVSHYGHNHSLSFSRAAAPTVRMPHTVFLPNTMTPPLNNPCFQQEATLVGTEGDDVLFGTAGNDVIVGLGGNDIILGGDGDDLICGGPGEDTLSGGNGRDHIHGNQGEDSVTGGNGNDVLRGGQNDDTILGGAGDDKIYGGFGNDSIDGNAGYNLVFAGGDTDSCAPNIGNFECEVDLGR